MGTIDYVAPEQIAGEEIDCRADDVLARLRVTNVSSGTAVSG